MSFSCNFGSQYFDESCSQQYQDYVISANEADEIDESEKNSDYYTAPATPDPNVDTLAVKLIDTLFFKKSDKQTEEKLPVFQPVLHKPPEPPKTTANPEPPEVNVNIVHVSSEIPKTTKKPEPPKNNENLIVDLRPEVPKNTDILVRRHYLVPQINKGPEIIRVHHLLPQINRNQPEEAPVIEKQDSEKNQEKVIEEPVNEKNQENNEDIEDYIEKRRCRMNAKRRFGEFFNSLTEEEYIAADLLKEYNTFFNDDITPIGLGRMIEMKNHFEKSRRRYNGYPTVFYKKRKQILPRQRKPRKKRTGEA